MRRQTHRWVLVCFLVAVGCARGGEADGEKAAATGTSAQTDTETVDDGWTKKVERLLEQAKQSFSAEDWTRTVQLVRKGLDAVEKSGRRGELLEGELLLILGDVEQLRGDEVASRRHYADATAIFHVHQSASGRFRTALSLGRLEARRGDYAAATRQFGEAEELVVELDDAAKAELQLQLGRLAARKVDHEKATAQLDEAIRLFKGAKNKAKMAEAFLLLAQEEDALDRTDASRRSLEAALSIFREVGDLRGEVTAMHRIAALLERDKKYRQARALLQKVYDLYVKIDDQTAAATVARHMGALPDPSDDGK